MKYTVHVGGQVREIELEPGAAPGAFSVKLGGRTLPVAARFTGDGGLMLLLEGRPAEVHVVPGHAGAPTTVCLEGQALEVRCHTAMEEQLARAASAAGDALELAVRTSMPGKIVEVRVAPGELVTAGQRLLILEAMKMENEIQAKGAARVKAVLVSPGQAVESGALLVELEPAPQEAR